MDDVFLTFVEVAVGLAGFAGVAAALVFGARLHPFDRNRIVNLFLVCFELLFLAVVPAILHELGFLGPRVWQAASGAMCVIWILSIARGWMLVGRRLRTDAGDDWAGTSLFIWIPSLVNFGLQITNAGGWIWQPSNVAYLFGLVIWVYGAGVLFLYAIFYRPTTES